MKPLMLTLSMIIPSLITVPAIAADLNISVVGLPNDTGSVQIALYDSAKTFMDDKHRTAALILKPKDKMVNVTLHDLPSGTYALAVFDDLNGNGVLDTNMIGIPVEPWGFSNDSVSAIGGQPSFEQAAFVVNEPGAKISVKAHQ
jgi:uncharacterized protein (DUF2141 family)